MFILMILNLSMSASMFLGACLPGDFYHSGGGNVVGVGPGVRVVVVGGVPDDNRVPPCTGGGVG